VFPQTKKNLRVREIKGEKHNNKQRKRVRTRERHKDKNRDSSDQI
jgi:hypothetical protein